MGQGKMSCRGTKYDALEGGKERFREETMRGWQDKAGDYSEGLLLVQELV